VHCQDPCSLIILERMVSSKSEMQYKPLSSNNKIRKGATLLIHHKLKVDFFLLILMISIHMGSESISTPAELFTQITFVNT